MTENEKCSLATRPRDRRSIIGTKAITHPPLYRPSINGGRDQQNEENNPLEEEEEASSVQLMISEDTQTSTSSWITSATQTDLIGNGSINMTSTPNGTP